MRQYFHHIHRCILLALSMLRQGPNFIFLPKIKPTNLCSFLKGILTLYIFSESWSRKPRLRDKETQVVFNVENLKALVSADFARTLLSHLKSFREEVNICTSSTRREYCMEGGITFVIEFSLITKCHTLYSPLGHAFFSQIILKISCLVLHKTPSYLYSS